MKKMLLLAFLLAAPLYAQTTTYTGTVRDLTGSVVTSGRITWTLNAPGGVSIPGTGSFVATTVSCLINASGSPVASSDGVSPCVITNNSAMTPTGTSYTMCRQPYFVTPGSCFVTYANGGTVDVSTIVPTAATQPSYGVANTGSDNKWSGVQTFSSTVTAASVNSVVNAKMATSAQSAVNSAGATGRVLFPVTTYPLTASLSPLIGNTFDCLGSYGGTGASATPQGGIWQLNSGVAAYAFQYASLPSEIIGLMASNCIVDLTQDSSALGGYEMQGINYSLFQNMKTQLPATGSMVGVDFNGTTGNYWNTLVNHQVFAAANNSSGNTHIGYQFRNQGNSETLVGSLANQVDTPFVFNNSTANTVVGGGADSWGTNFAHFLSGASGNTIIGARAETNQSNTAGKTNIALLNFDSGTYNNEVFAPWSGSLSVLNAAAVIDNSNGSNNYEVKDTANNYHIKVTSSVGKNMAYGLNKIPSCYPNFQFGCFDVHGFIQTDAGILSTAPYQWQQWYTPIANSSFLPIAGTVTAIAQSSTTVTVTDSAFASYSAGDPVTIYTSPTDGCASWNGLTLTVASSGSGAWTATVGVSGSSSTGCTIASSFISQPSVTAFSIAAGVITFTQHNEWAAGESVSVQFPEGSPWTYLSGNYTVLSSPTTTAWTANVPLKTLTTINVNGSTIAAAHAGGTYFIYPPGTGVNITISGTGSGYSGNYTSNGIGAGALWNAACAPVSCASTGGTISVTGTSQLYTVSSQNLTSEPATATALPIQLWSVDPLGNVTYSPRMNGTTLSIGSPTKFTGSMSFAAASYTVGTASLPAGNSFIGPSAGHTFSWSASGLTGNRTYNAPDTNSGTISVGLASACANGGAVGYMDTSGIQHCVNQAYAGILTSGSTLWNPPATCSGATCNFFQGLAFIPKVTTPVTPWRAPAACTLRYFAPSAYINGTLDTASDTVTLQMYNATTSTAYTDTAVTVSFNAISNTPAPVTNSTDAVAANDKLVMEVILPTSWTTTPTSVFVAANFVCQ